MEFPFIYTIKITNYFKFVLPVLITFLAHCYGYVGVNEAKTFADAEAYCKAHGSNLASIHSDADSTAVQSICVNELQTSWCLIGITDIDTEGVWQWSDGSGTDNLYSKWFDNHGNGCGDSINCALFYDNKSWHCRVCADLLVKFVCNSPFNLCMIYLTSLEAISQSKPAINEGIGGIYPMQMGDGNTYDEEMIIHPPENGQTHVEWNLNGEYLQLTAIIGPTGSFNCGANPRLQFIISIDNVIVYTSQAFTSASQYENIAIDVSGVNILKISTDSLGGACGDWATIANPILTSITCNDNLSNSPTQFPSDNPSNNPSGSPTKAPSRSPTESPTYKVCNLQELDWDALNTDNDSPQLSSPIITSSWDEQTLQFNIEITLDYITRSKYTFVHQYDTDRGITYVIDTQPFLSDGRLLSNPNNCENREFESFVEKNWNTQYWSYLNQANGLNSIDYLEYGPSNIWTLNWDNECETITYSKVFLFHELLSCTDKDGANTFVFIEDTQWLNLTGTFYITLVSPLLNQNNVIQSAIDIGQYLTNTIGNYPISISFAKKIASIRDPGLVLFDISIFAIQYDSKNNSLLIDVLSYTAQYINLQNVIIITPDSEYLGNNNIINSITINEDDSYSGLECLFETTFRCFQKFQIEIDLISCPSSSIDLSTAIILDTEPSCRSGEDCTLFRSEFGPIGTTVLLTDTLSYTESCDTEIYIQTFEASIKYFRDIDFTTEVDEKAEFAIGSTLYVHVSANDIAAYGVFSIDILNVWICTTSQTDLAITSQLTGQGGCIESYSSNNAQAANIDEIYQAFKDGVAYNTDLDAQIYVSLNEQSVRFSLKIPAFQKSKFWLHAIVNLRLENNERRRMRLLLVSQDLGESSTVNRLSHYIKSVSIVYDIIQTTEVSKRTTNDDYHEASSTAFYYSYVISILSFFMLLF